MLLISKRTLGEIENDIAVMIREMNEEVVASPKKLKELEEKNCCTPYHWTPYQEDWSCRGSRWDGREVRHIFGEHCKWKHQGFIGFMDDYGWFRYMPGNC